MSFKPTKTDIHRPLRPGVGASLETQRTRGVLFPVERTGNNKSQSWRMKKMNNLNCCSRKRSLVFVFRPLTGKQKNNFLCVLCASSEAPTPGRSGR
jgi:hypothetical protein